MNFAVFLIVINFLCIVFIFNMNFLLFIVMSVGKHGLPLKFEMPIWMCTNKIKGLFGQ